MPTGNPPESVKIRVINQTDPNGALSSVVWDDPNATTTNTEDDTIQFTGCDDPSTTGVFENSKDC